MLKSLTFFVLLLFVIWATVNSEFVFRLPIPHQLENILDLLTPIHIRFATDGVKHRP